MVDVLVVGGGIIGTLIALECQARGAQVTVVDAGAARPSASWAGGGILSPLFPWRCDDGWLPLTAQAQARYRAWGAAIVAAGMTHPELNDCGMLVRAPADQGVPAWAARHGVDVRPATQASLPSAFIAEAHWWLPGVSAVRNPQWLSALRTLSRARGVRWLDDEVLALSPGAVTLARAGKVAAADVVVSAGHWSRQLLPAAGVQDALQPVKGEMLLYRLAPGTVPAILLADEGYLIPRRDGLVLAGSTLEPGVSDQRPSARASGALQAMAARWCPSLADCTPVAQWAGVRPGNRRALPFIGPVPDRAGVWLACGHFRNGLVSAPATAQLVAEMLAGDAPFCDPAPYSVSS